MTTSKDEEAEALAKERLILKLFKLYRYLDGKADRALTEQYLAPVLRFTTQAVALAYESIRDGGLEEGKDWLPQVPRWVSHVRRYERASPPIALHNGLIQMDFGHGMVDMRGLTTEEQDQIRRQHGLTADGKNMALMSLDEKRASLKLIEGPKAKRITPKIQRMA